MDDNNKTFARRWGRKVLSLAILFVRLAAAQETPYAVSPKAGELARSGRLPVNGSSGQIRLQLPVETVRAAGYDWPVTLNYAYNGLRLDEPPSEVGLGWSLAGAGGAIVREVRGLPDEHPRGYWGVQSRRSWVNDIATGKDVPLSVLKDFAGGLYDAEPDRFIVSAGPLSFSFVINGEGCGTCAPSGLSVTPDPGGARIRFGWHAVEITDDDGVVYLFDVLETAGFHSAHPVNQDEMPQYVSAWHLSRIQPMTGLPIEFDYGRTSIRSVQYTEQYDRTAAASGIRVDIDCSTVGESFNSGFRGQQQFRELSHRQSHQVTDMQVPFLSDIRWADGGLRFLRTPEPDGNGLPTVDQVRWLDRDGRAIRSMSFSYDRQARRLLRRLMTDSIVVHGFEYFPIDIPHVVPAGESVSTGRVSPYAQDFWGFANGRQNTSSIPEKGADRRPNFEAARQGAMRRVIWPTGGSTEIKYEPNRVRVTPAEVADVEPAAPNRSKSMAVYSAAGEQKEESASIEFTRVTFVRISHQVFLKGVSGRIVGSFYPRNGCATGNCQDLYRYAREQRELNPDTAPRFVPIFAFDLTGDVVQSGCGQYDVCESRSVDQWIRIEPGVYDFDVRIDQASSAAVQVFLEWYDVDPDQCNPAYFDVDAAGIRVSETADCALDDSPCVRRLYRYTEEDGFSSGRWLNTIDLEYAYRVHDAVDCRDHTASTLQGFPSLPLYLSWSYTAVSRQFRTLNPLLLQSGSPVGYSRLELWDDAEASRGREVFSFHTGDRGHTGAYPYSPKVADPKDGLMWRHQFIRAGDSAVVQESEEWLSSFSPADLQAVPMGLVFGRGEDFRYTPTGGSEPVEDLLKKAIRITPYPAEPARVALTMRKADRFESGRFTIEHHYRYNERLQLRSDSTINSDGTTVKHVWQYPEDAAGLEWKALIALNATGIPIRRETLINGVVRQTEREVYRVWPQSGDRPAREKTESSADGHRVISTQVLARTTDGFPSEVVNRDGIRTALVWDVNGRDRLAVVEGASIRDVWFNGFESDASIGVIEGEAHTGRRYSERGIPFTRSGLTAGGKFRLQWWRRTVSGWSLQEQELVASQSGSVSVFLEGPVDDVRFFPADARMTSYTINPLLGVTSQTDPNGKTRFFEFDSLGRLRLIRDHNGDIVRRHRYHLAGQLAED